MFEIFNLVLGLITHLHQKNCLNQIRPKLKNLTQTEPLHCSVYNFSLSKIKEPNQSLIKPNPPLILSAVFSIECSFIYLSFHHPVREELNRM